MFFFQITFGWIAHSSLSATPYPSYEIFFYSIIMHLSPDLEFETAPFCALKKILPEVACEEPTVAIHILPYHLISASVLDGGAVSSDPDLNFFCFRSRVKPI